MNIPVSRIKVTAPRRRSDLLSRPRLTLLIDELLENKLILISAPAGYGKTSLFIDLANTHEFPHCWYNLDETDQDVFRFVAHLIASIDMRFKGFETACSDSFLAAIQNNATPKHLARLLAEEVFQYVREHVVIILDDYHMVDQSESVSAFINHFAQEVDENIHLVLLSRNLFSFDDLPLMVARSLVGGLGFQELSFHPDEIQKLLLQNYSQVIPDAVAVDLANRTEGWITGLLLSAQTMWQGMADRERLARISGVKLYDYLIHQILDQQPDELRKFLLMSSLFDEFDADLCQAVFGPPTNSATWQTMIRRVVQYNLFVVPIDEDRTWLRYHQLFRDFLRELFAKEYPEEEVQLIRSLAEVYAQRKDWDRAYACLQRLKDTDAIVALLEQAGEPMVMSHQLTRLAEYLDALPPGVLESHPKLLARRGIVAATLGQTHWGLTLLNQAVSALNKEQDLAHLAGTLVWRALVHFIQTNHSASQNDVDEVLRLAEQPDQATEIPLQFKAEALRIRGLNAWHMGDLHRAAESLTQSLELHKMQGNTTNITRLLLSLGPVYIETGKIKLGISYLVSALEYYRNENNSYMLSGVLNDIAYVHYLHGEYDQADAAFEEALQHARSSHNRRVQALVLTGLGDLYLDLDAYQAAEAAYSQAIEVAQGIEDQFLLLYLSLAQSGLARTQENSHRAQRFLDAARIILQRSESKYTHALYALEAGRVALAQQEHYLAINPLEDAVRLFDESGQRVEACRARFCLAMAYQSCHKTEDATLHLQKAFSLALELENPHTLLPAGRRMQAALGAFKTNRVVGRQVTLLLEAAAQFEQSIPDIRKRLRHQQSTRPIKTSRLQIQALGKAEVTIDNQAIPSSEWQSQKNRDLFFLILSSEKGWTKEAIGEQLWPDSSPAQLRLRFKNAIYRVRRVLGQDVIVFDGERYAFNRKLDYTYDVDKFIVSLERSEHAKTSTESSEAYREALRLYHGEYLPDVYEAWATIEREHLNRLFVETSIQLARTGFERGEFSYAMKVCQALIEKNPFLEEAHRMAMQIYAAQGDRASVIQQYNSLKRSLQSQMGVLPSPQTETLYQELIH
jgi:LuxR family transcriptional regulator, maltose regulon positive regulatory protein